MAQIETQFRAALLELRVLPHILELGCLRWEIDCPTHHVDWHPGGVWVRSDIEPGLDVDIVMDAHDLAPCADGTFDAYIAMSVYEHLRQPWVAAQQAARVLRPGGILFVMTHQTFPIHGYPSDYFRFTDVALASIFQDAGLTIVMAAYEYPCQIIPPSEITRWNPGAEAFLNVNVFARKD